MRTEQEIHAAAMRELERLTPQGLEFYNDPEACVRYIHIRIDDSVRRCKERVYLRRALRTAQMQLTETMEMLGKALILIPDDTVEDRAVEAGPQLLDVLGRLLDTADLDPDSWHKDEEEHPDDCALCAALEVYHNVQGR